MIQCTLNLIIYVITQVQMNCFFNHMSQNYDKIIFYLFYIYCNEKIILYYFFYEYKKRNLMLLLKISLLKYQ